jgi:hypothetical protein
LALFQETIAGVDLKQLIGRAGTKTLRFALCDIGVVELALSLRSRKKIGFRALTRLQRAPAFASGKKF